MKKWNKALVMLLMLTLALATTACGASSSPQSALMMSSTAAAMANETAGAEDGGGELDISTDTNTAATPPKDNRQLIRTVYLEIETKDFDGVSNTIVKQIELLGGYIEKSEVSGRSYNSENRRYASIVARIPKDKVDGFISVVDEAGNITNRQESVEDVTLQYVDVESHKKSLIVEQERLMAMLEKAEKIEDIIMIETRLSDVRYQLESYESQLRTYDNQVDYSTVTMNVNEVERITPIEEKTVWNRMTSGLQTSVYDISIGLQNYSVWFVVNLPYLVLWGIIVAVISLVLIKLTSHSKKPKQVKMAAAKPQWPNYNTSGAGNAPKMNTPTDKKNDLPKE